MAPLLTRAAPINDSFTNRIVLTGETNYVTTSNVGASTEPGEPHHASIVGGSSLWWTWRASVTGSYAVSTEGSSFDTIMAVYQGSNVTNLKYVAADDDSGSNSTSFVIFRAIAGENYEIAVDGFSGDSGNIVLRLFASGYPAPTWNLSTMFGTNVSSTSFRNKVLLIDFFETVCTACRDETPALIFLQNYYSPQGFEIIGITKDTSVATVFYGVRDLGINYTVLMNRVEVEDAFGGPMMIPTKFLVDRDGKIQMKIIGAASFTYYNQVINPFMRHASNVPLKIRRQPSQLLLSWPATEFGWTLQTSSGLSPGSWLPFIATVFDTNNENTVAMPYPALNSFFRLTRP